MERSGGFEPECSLAAGQPRFLHLQDGGQNPACFSSFPRQQRLGQRMEIRTGGGHFIETRLCHHRHHWLSLQVTAEGHVHTCPYKDGAGTARRLSGLGEREEGRVGSAVDHKGSGQFPFFLGCVTSPV